MGPELPAEAADLAREASSVGARRIDPTAMVRRGRRPAPAAGATSAAPPAARMLVQARRAQVGVPESPRPAMAHAQRRGTAKRRALQRGGGSAETEAAVLAGLRYLKSIQRRNGSWGRNHRHNKYGDFRVGKTALCLLAFLGSGHTHQENGEFQETVRRGLDWLISQQDRPTGHFGDSSAYGHGISTYAFAEAYAMTRDPRLRGPLRRAVGRVVTAQMTSRERKLDGGWPYYYRDPDRRHDRFPRMSVSVWQVMALKSARIGGINVPETSLQRAKRFVLAAHDPRLHAFRYNHDPEWLSTSYPTLPGTTPAALFALQLLGGDRTGEEYQTGLRYIGRRPLMTRWRRYSDEEFATRGLSNLYYYYYATLALFFEGGDAWKQWNSRLTRLLVGGQDRDGSWRPVSYYAEYARDTDRDRVYTTAMSVLMLEVYYRYFTPLLTSMEKSK
ncbi:MAG: hypothetical protein CMJ83_21495 [Planctomycetes bacterium]|nr:hypothetical protein [Planctomycetota bacterium]